MSPEVLKALGDHRGRQVASESLSIDPVVPAWLEMSQKGSLATEPVCEEKSLDPSLLWTNGSGQKANEIGCVIADFDVRK